MTDIIQNDEPFTIKWNDQPVEIYESITVVNSGSTLKQIPDRLKKVFIDGYSEVQSPVNIGANQYYVDYNMGVLSFSSSTTSGTVLNSHYYGRGIISIPAKRVSADTTNPDVQSNLQDMIDNYNNLNNVDMYTKFDPNSGHKHSGNAGDAPPIPAVNIPISDSGNIINSNNVEDALQEHGNTLNDHSSQLADTITIKPTGANDTQSWNNAVNILANGGKINLTHGDYYVDGGTLKSDIIIHGRGFPRILSDTIIFNINSGSADATNNINNITFEYVVIEAITKTFSEFVHLLSLSGVSNITFRDCIFKGFKGDGVYLGSGDSGQERHNENVHFYKCIFDGVNNQNRNGVSIIDGDGVFIEKCIFKNCTQPNMPGAVDIEPNANAWSIIRNIHVRKCKFKNVGGNTGVVAMNLPLSQSQLTNPVENITIEGNVIDTTLDTQGAFSFHQHQDSKIDNTSIDLNIKIINNKAKNLASRPFIFTGCKNVRISKNEFENAYNTALVSYTGTTDKCVDIKLSDNTFKKCGTGDGKGLSVFDVDRLDIIRTLFEDCGISGNTNGYGIDFNTGTSSNVRIIGCDFISPLGIMSTAIQKESTHTFTPSTNIDQENRYNGLVNNFAANLKDPISYYSVTTYDTTKLPDSFTQGTQISLVNGDTNLPSSYKQGTLVTTVPTLTSGYRKFITQWFYPANNESVTLADMYFRKANGATNDWSVWKKITGV